MKKVINILLIGIILLSLTAVIGAHASGTPYSVSGTVIDRYGNPIPGADVTLVDYTGNTIKSMKTDSNGNFVFVNVVAETNTSRVQVSYTDSDGTTYTMPSYYCHWYPTKGMIMIPSADTQIPTYPPPNYGYLYGAIQTDSTSTNARFIDGIVYLVSLDNDAKYYEFAENTNGKSGSFSFYVPPGQYVLYAQHWENGVVYESAHKQVSVGRNADITDVLETRIILPLNTPSSDPDPSEIPAHNSNKINGSVLTKDGKGVSGATVTLWETADNGTGYVPMKDGSSKVITAVTDNNGYYEFNGITPTTNDGKVIQSKKNIKVMVTYTDPNGTQQTITQANSDARSLYYPDVILGYGMENAARNVAMPTVTLPYSVGGWVSLISVPSGANIYVDGQQLFGPDNKPLTTPTTAYIDPGTHEIKMSKEGYSDSTDTITMVANTKHDDFIMSLQKSIFPPWVTLVVAVIILLIVVVLFIALLATRIKLILAPFSRLLSGLGKKLNDHKASREIARAHKAEMAEQKRAEQQRWADERAPTRREPVRARRDAGMRAETYDRDDVPVVNVDPVKRRHEPRVFEESRKVFDGGKKILDIDLKRITSSMPKKTTRRRGEDDGDRDDRSPVVFASDIYKKPSMDVERIPYDSSPRPAYNERESLAERPQAAPERSERFRLPRISQQRDSSSLGDKERVIKYIRDHPEGSSFIQMSNDLEIVPNTLTYITKELVINDDIEKVKGLYYYKSHTSPAEDSKSSVVVWRLDGDK